MTLIDLLCAHENPVVAYRARLLLAGESESSRVLRRLRRAIGASEMANRLLLALNGERWNPYRKWQGPHWTLYSLAEIGFPATYSGRPDGRHEAKHGVNLSGVKRFLFRHCVRKWMNHNVSRIRRGEWQRLGRCDEETVYTGLGRIMPRSTRKAGEGEDVERPFIRENAAERTRLRNLVASMTDQELRVTLPNGWPVSVALAHVAFWDQRSTVLMSKWMKDGIAPSPSPIDIDAINDTLIPFLSALPPRSAAELAISCAEAVDAQLERAPDDFIAGLQALGDRFRLYRSDHRRLHLDKIESALRR